MKLTLLKCGLVGNRAAYGVVLGLLLLAPASRGADSTDGVTVDLSIERDLLMLAVRSHDQLVAQQAQAYRRVDDLEERIDGLVHSRQPTENDLLTLERLSASLAIAQASSSAFAEQLSLARQRVVDHQRRILRLQRALEAIAAEEQKDPISGDWVILVMPSGQQGLFELSLDGTVVSGEYRLDGEFYGSLRGTYVNRRLKLERIDSRHGFDVVYEGVLNPAARRIDGRWRSTRLEAPGAAGGQWRATRPEKP